MVHTLIIHYINRGVEGPKGEVYARGKRKRWSDGATKGEGKRALARPSHVPGD